MTIVRAAVPLTGAKPTPVSQGSVFDPYVRFNVDQYDALMRAGFLEEGAPIELLDGMLCWKDRRDRGSPDMVIGIRHRLAVMKLYRWLEKITEGHHCYPMSQQPVTLSKRDTPEPDDCLVRGELEDHQDRHPGPRDLIMIAEIADSSLNRDLGYKRQLYSNVGIPIYWIVNLDDEVLEVYELPDTAIGEYRQRTVYHKGESVSLTLADGTVVSTPVDALLP